MGRVIVVGSINRDRVVRCVDLPRPGETVVALSSHEGFGGKGGNQAVAASQAGAVAVLVAVVGNDEAGGSAVADLRRWGVDVSAVSTIDGQRTGLANVFLDSRSENFIVLEPGANHSLFPAAVRHRMSAVKPTAGDVLLTSGEVGAEVVAAAAEVARERGLLHVHNTAPVHPLGRWSDGDHVLLIANEVEAAQLTGTDDPTTAAARLATGRGGALVTIGSRGAIVARGDDLVTVPAPRVTAVDSTGAGDAFCGTFSAAIAAGCDLQTATGRAVRAGASAVTVLGARGDVLDSTPPLDPRAGDQ